MRTWSSGRCWLLIFSPPRGLTLWLPGWPSSFAICWEKKLKECGRRHLIYCTIHDSKHLPKIPSGEPGMVSFAWIPVGDSLIKYTFPRCVSVVSLKIVSMISPRTNELHSAFWPPSFKKLTNSLVCPRAVLRNLFYFKMNWKDFYLRSAWLKRKQETTRKFNPKRIWLEKENRFLDSMGEGEGGMIWENSIETCILSSVKQIASPSWMHETSARDWCTGMTQRDGMGCGGRWEGGSGWGTHVNPWLIHVNVWQKPLQYYKVISLQLIKNNWEKKNMTGKAQLDGWGGV